MTEHTPAPAAQAVTSKQETMTSERIDHVAEAKAHLDEVADYPPAIAPWAGVRAQCAQAHATLALAEQQRVANLIEYMRLVNSDPSQAMDLTPDIAAALGLTNGGSQ